MTRSVAEGFSFSKDALDFFADLKVNNSKEWFADNKPRYEQSVHKPSKIFVEHLQPVLEELSGDRMVPKIFRIHRDLRFSKDKTPYKAYQHFLFSPSGRGKSGPAFFFGLEPERLFVGAGMFDFSKSELDQFRQKVLAREGAELASMLDRLLKQGKRLHEPALKKVPRGFDPEHERSRLLLHKGLSVWSDIEDPMQATRSDLIPFLETEFKTMLPIYSWLSEHVLNG